MTRFCVADLAGCYQGTEHDIATRVSNFISRGSYEDESVFVFARPDQEHVRGLFPVRASWINVVDRVDAVSRVRLLLGDEGAIRRPATVDLISYTGAVLRNGTLHSSPSLAVRPVPLSEVGRQPANSETAPDRAAVPQWGFDFVAPLDAAIAVLTEALQRRGATAREQALRLTDLRPVMSFVDRRFAGKGKGSPTSGMITTLVSLAEKKGVVHIDRTSVIGNALIWLADGRTSASGTSGNGSSPLSLNGTTAPTAVPTPPAVNVINSPRADVSIHTSRRWEAVLAENDCKYDVICLLGIIDQLPEAVELHKGKILDQVVRSAAEAAEPEVQRHHPERDASRSWRRSRRDMKRLLTQAEVVLDASGNPLGLGWRSERGVVHSLVDGWRTRVDAHMMLPLFGLVEVKQGDEEDLAGLYFHARRDPEAIERIQLAIEWLLEEGLILEEIVNGLGVLRPRGPEQASDHD